MLQGKEECVAREGGVCCKGTRSVLQGKAYCVVDMKEGKTRSVACREGRKRLYCVYESMKN